MTRQLASLDMQFHLRSAREKESVSLRAL